MAGPTSDTNYLPMSRHGLPPKSGVSGGPRPPGTTPGAQTTFTRAAGGAGKKSALAFFHLKILFGRAARAFVPRCHSGPAPAYLPNLSLTRKQLIPAAVGFLSGVCVCECGLDGV
jgi:hypothetical protein